VKLKLQGLLKWATELPELSGTYARADDPQVLRAPWNRELASDWRRQTPGPGTGARKVPDSELTSFEEKLANEEKFLKFPSKCHHNHPAYGADYIKRWSLKKQKKSEKLKEKHGFKLQQPDTQKNKENIKNERRCIYNHPLTNARTGLVRKKHVM
jgi:hypothetical protein